MIASLGVAALNGTFIGDLLENVASKSELARIVELEVREAAAIARFLNEGRQRNRVDPRDFARTLADAERDVEARTRQGG